MKMINEIKKEYELLSIVMKKYANKKLILVIWQNKQNIQLIFKKKLKSAKKSAKNHYIQQLEERY